MALIEDYGLIGDLQSAALVSREGCIDWLCLPRFDSGACFAALVGTPENGQWRIQPSGEFRPSGRRYRGDTLVLETDLETDAGMIRLIDFMPPREHRPDVVRLVHGLRGKVDMEMELAIRFDYGSTIPWVHNLDGTLVGIAGPDAVSLHTPVNLEGRDLRTHASFTVAEGETVPFVLTWFASHEKRPEPVDAQKALDETISFWEEWSSQCANTGRWDDAVRRSLLTLKALTYAPTGGIVAAPTTSLPEAIGGVRNWDYRYCWLRDATLTLLALIRAGYIEEARAWRDWLLRAIAGDPEDLQIMYGVAGERRLAEFELPWLAGYEGSRPVRVGNGASNQLQLDVYGEVIDALYQARRQGLHASDDAWALSRKNLDWLESGWRQEDEGIWEVRGPRRHFTHSKLMAWVAFDRAVQVRRAAGTPRPRRALARRAVRDPRGHPPLRIRRRPWPLRPVLRLRPTRRESAPYTARRVPARRRLPCRRHRRGDTTRAPARQLRRALSRRRRERGGRRTASWRGRVPPVLVLARCGPRSQGHQDEATELFERLLALRSDLGLLAEEYDPERKRLLGNFPQAFTHVALVETAFTLSKSAG